jgi:GTP-binding protein
MLKVAIIGRPNVGKSTLFNRLAGKRFALTHDAPGVTRDWREAPASLYDLDFQIIDTAGMEEAAAETLQRRMTDMTSTLIAQADVALFMVDARAGLHDADKEVAKLLRKSGKPVILVGNKCDENLPDAFDELHRLGFEDPVALSAEHGLGMRDLYDALKSYATDVPPEEDKEEDEEVIEGEEPERALHLAVIGRPNAGKSTLINALLGYERMLTGPEAGLTRDAVPIEWNFEGKRIRLVDTPGLRKSFRVHEKLEEMSVAETMRAIRLAHIVVLVVDANVMFEKQDLHIAQVVEREGRPLVLAINKWDTITNKQEVTKALRGFLNKNLAQLPDVPLVMTSALNKKGGEEVMQEVMKAYDLWNQRISTSALNKWLAPLLEHHSPPLVSGKRIKIRYMTQIKSRPPTFVLWVTQPLKLPDTYLRYLSNEMRRAFDLPGIPLRFVMRKGDNPYVKDRD